MNTKHLFTVLTGLVGERKSFAALALTAAVFSSPLLMAQTASTAAASNSSSIKKTDAISKQDKRFFLEVGLEKSSNLRSEDSRDLDASTGIALSPSWEISKRFTLTGKVGVDKQEVGPKDTLISDSTLGLNIKGYKFNQNFSMLHILSGLIPTSKKSQEVDHLQSAVSLGNRLVLDSRYGKFSYTLGMRRNFHEFVLNVDDSPNLEYILSHRILMDVPLIGDFSLSGDFIYRNAWTYRNFERQSFSFAVDLGYAVTETFSVYVGTTNEGSALKANGKDSNLDLYNENSSVIRAGVTYVL